MFFEACLLSGSIKKNDRCSASQNSTIVALTTSGLFRGSHRLIVQTCHQTASFRFSRSGAAAMLTECFPYMICLMFSRQPWLLQTPYSGRGGLASLAAVCSSFLARRPRGLSSTSDGPLVCHVRFHMP